MKGKNEAYWIIGLLILLAASCAALGWRIQSAKNQDSGMKLVLYEGPVSLPDATEADMGFASEARRDISLNANAWVCHQGSCGRWSENHFLKTEW